ncbi:MAG: hypothetical protein BWZ08_02434 [candidate division BRC1 bacterium ADurb.BinA292]|nr:MAG: hypothetical protein BWZ08_02434 [candidate division BRC1 bacterium ADurb.BinA292]
MNDVDSALAHQLSQLAQGARIPPLTEGDTVDADAGGFELVGQRPALADADERQLKPFAVEARQRGD